VDELDKYLTELMLLESRDYMPRISVISVIDRLLDIRNVVARSHMPFDGDEYTKERHRFNKAE